MNVHYSMNSNSRKFETTWIFVSEWILSEEQTAISNKNTGLHLGIKKPERQAARPLPEKCPVSGHGSWGVRT